MEQLEKMYDGIHLDEGLATEILVLLPAKSVFRFRAVCREWLRIIDGPGFLAAHARRRPLEVLLYTRTTVASIDLQELDAVDVSAHRPAPRRHLARYTEKTGALNYSMYDRRQYCSLLASCDGLLLLRNNGPLSGDDLVVDHGAERHLVCNPTTRQWSDLPRVSWDAGEQRHCVAQRESGFYFHEPSGEYRLLCHITFSRTEVPYYYVFSTGADEPRRLSAQATPMEQTIHASKLKAAMFIRKVMTPAVLHGHLHWLQHMEAGLTDQMVAFDTAAETFRRMPPPPVTCTERSSLLVADGSLMASELGDLFVDLWVLEGYGGCAGEGTWQRRHRVEVPWKTSRAREVKGPLVVAAGDGGDVVLGMSKGVVAYNLKSRTVRQVVGVGGGTLSLSRHVFRESLVRHGFFDTRPHPGFPLISLCS